MLLAPDTARGPGLELLGSVPSLVWPLLAVCPCCSVLLFYTSLYPAPTVAFEICAGFGFVSCVDRNYRGAP